jgi:hypothetical protein
MASRDLLRLTAQGKLIAAFSKCATTTNTVNPNPRTIAAPARTHAMNFVRRVIASS